MTTTTTALGFVLASILFFCFLSRFRSKLLGLVLVALVLSILGIAGWIQFHPLPISAQKGSASVQPPSYRALAKQDAVNAGIDPTLFVKQINQESGFNPNAVSPAGAVGIAQFMPTTAVSLGVDPHDPVQSLQAAATLMHRYLTTYHGSYPMALTAYNAGTRTLQRALTHGDAWKDYLPRETQNYITSILS